MRKLQKTLNRSFLLLIVIIISCKNKEKEEFSSRVGTLPYYNDASFTPKWIGSKNDELSSFHKIPNFELINQNGEKVTQKTFENKIYITDFFFTTCQTICPIMTDHMVEIQKEIIDDPDVMLLSHSVTPEIDNVAQLKRYAEKKGVNAKKWNLVTGDKKEIYKLARKSYLAVKDNGDGGPFDMVHTENFMLIDKKRQIRGFYDGTNAEDIDRLLEDIQILKEEK